MIAHPILASEDDEDLVCRTIYSLPDDMEALFTLVRHVYDDGRTDLKSKLNVQHTEVSRMVQVLSGVPDGSFHSVDGVETSLTDVLNQIVHLWKTELYRVHQGTMAWHSPLVRLAQDASDLLMRSRVRFPASRRLQRQLSSTQSFTTITVVVLYLTVLVGMCIAVIVIPSVGTSANVGVTVGVVLSVLLITLSMVVLWAYHTTMVALDALFERLFFEKVAGQGGQGAGRPIRGGLESLGAAFQEDSRNNPMVSSLSDHQSIQDHRGPRNKVPPTKPSAKKHSKLGFYTISYDNDVGWIDGQFLDTQVVMIGFDEAYRVTLWNSAAEATTGFLETECLGKPLSDLVDSPSGDIKLDVLSMRKHNTRSQTASLKIRLRAFATAPVTLFTIIAPITGMDGSTVGSIFICANAKDNLKEARAFLHDYQLRRIQVAADALAEQGTIGHEEMAQVRTMSTFASWGYAKNIEDLARTMVFEWEWTTGNQLFARALGTLLGKCVLNLPQNFPQTLCVNTYIAGTIGNAVQEAPSRCEVTANVENCASNQVYQLNVSISVPSSSRPFDVEKSMENLSKTLAVTFAYIRFTNDDATMELQFPCQVSMLMEDLGESQQTGGVQGEGEAAPGVACSVNVITLLADSVDRHNLSMVLLKTIYVSLTNVQDPRDLDKKIASHDVDVIIADRAWFSTAKALVQNHCAAGSIMLIPLIPQNDNAPSEEDAFSPTAILPTESPSFHMQGDGDAAQGQQGQYVIRSPIQRNVLEALMMDVAKEVEKKKAAIAEQDEREKILMLRQDSPWTQGKLLGRGAFGAVYEAISDLTGGKMAVKMFYFRQTENESHINDLLNEIKIMCSLNHPNIVHYFYCERKDNSVNLFMELCDHSLADHISTKSKRTSGLVLKASIVLKQVIAAVAYLHGRSIAHRDIKPQNILLKQEKIKLTDFGTSRQTSEELLDTQGTFRYMAPEVYKGEAHTMSCDIWSIGCLACELFLCPPRFMENRFSALLGEMTTVELPPHVNGVLRGFLEQCLQLQPQLRPTAQMLLLHPLLVESPEVASLPTVFDAKASRHSIAANMRQGAFSLSSSMSSETER